MNQLNTPVTMTSLEMVEHINGQRQSGEALLTQDNFMKKVPKVFGSCAVNFYATYQVPGP